MKHIASCIFLFFITSCASTAYFSGQEMGASTHIEINENRLIYSGEITKEANQKLFQVYESQEQKPTLLSINSRGGDIYDGVELGTWVFDNNNSVFIDNICASSCANYVFPAAKRKILLKNSILVWHGSTFQKSMDDMVREGHKGFLALRKKEENFFKKIDVDYRITIYGIDKIEQHHFWYASLFNKTMAGFDYSLEDLRKFGITGIILEDKEWDWRRYSSGNAYVVRVKVSL